MLQQIDDARQGQRRAETQAAKIQRQRDQLQSELTELRMQLSVQAHELEQRTDALEAATQEAARSAAERQALMTDLAGSRGRLEGIENAMRSLEARAITAERAPKAAASSRRTRRRKKRDTPK